MVALQRCNLIVRQMVLVSTPTLLYQAHSRGKDKTLMKTKTERVMNRQYKGSKMIYRKRRKPGLRQRTDATAWCYHMHNCKYGISRLSHSILRLRLDGHRRALVDMEGGSDRIGMWYGALDIVMLRIGACVRADAGDEFEVGVRYLYVELHMC